MAHFNTIRNNPAEQAHRFFKMKRLSLKRRNPLLFSSLAQKQVQETAIEKGKTTFNKF